MLAIVEFACAQRTTPQRELTERIHGVLCDPSQSTLVAEESNQGAVDDPRDLRRYRLYRTDDGHYFEQSEIGNDISLHLLTGPEGSGFGTFQQEFTVTVPSKGTVVAPPVTVGN